MDRERAREPGCLIDKTLLGRETRDLIGLCNGGVTGPLHSDNAGSDRGDLRSSARIPRSFR